MSERRFVLPSSISTLLSSTLLSSSLLALVLAVLAFISTGRLEAHTLYVESSNNPNYLGGLGVKLNYGEGILRLSHIIDYRVGGVKYGFEGDTVRNDTKINISGLYVRHITYKSTDPDGKLFRDNVGTFVGFEAEF